MQTEVLDRLTPAPRAIDLATSGDRRDTKMCETSKNRTPPHPRAREVKRARIVVSRREGRDEATFHTLVPNLFSRRRARRCHTNEMGRAPIGPDRAPGPLAAGVDLVERTALT